MHPVLRLASVTRIAVTAIFTLIALIIMSRPAAAAGFVGAPPLATNDSIWVLVDGGDPASRVSIDAVEKLGARTLKLTPKASLLRFSPGTHDLRALERSFERNGEIGLALSRLTPTVIVLVFAGSNATDFVYDKAALDADWLASRISTVRASCRGSLVVAVIDALGADAERKILSRSGPEDAALMLLHAQRGNNGVADLSLESLFNQLSQGNASWAPLADAIETTFGLSANKDIHTSPTIPLFTAALLGAADNGNQAGYTPAEIASWMGSISAKIGGGAGLVSTSISTSGSVDGRPFDISRYVLKRRQYRIGTCISALDVPAANPGQTFAQRVASTAEELRAIVSDAVTNRTALYQANTLSMDVITNPTNKSTAPILARPADCYRTAQKADYDLWISLIHVKEDRYLYDVQRQPTGLSFSGSPENPNPDRRQTQDLLRTDIDRLVRPVDVTSVAPRLPSITNEKSGVIFLVDRSPSNMAVNFGSDPDGKNRMAAMERVIEEVEQNAGVIRSDPLPVAVISFNERARVIKPNGSAWFKSTRAAFAEARSEVADGIKDGGSGTNLSAAIEEAGKLAAQQPGVGTWHIVLMTDGQPTVGITHLDDLAELTKKTLHGRCILHAFILLGQKGYTQETDMQELVRQVNEGFGRRGETVTLKAGTPESKWRDGVDRVGMQIARSSVLSSVPLTCEQRNDAIRCRGDRMKLGDVSRGVMFVMSNDHLSEGPCEVVLSNQGLPGGSTYLELREGMNARDVSLNGVSIELTRGADHLYVKIHSTSDVLNGEWSIQVTAASAAGRKP